MPINDWDGQMNYPIETIHDWDGATNHPIQRIYDWDGTAEHDIWRRGGEAPSEKEETLEVSSLQDGNWRYKELTVEGYSTISVVDFTPAQSYGSASTYLAVYRNGWLNYTLRDMGRTYNGTGFVDHINTPPKDVYYGLQNGDVIKLGVSATYDPNVSGQHTSTARAVIRLSR